MCMLTKRVNILFDEKLWRELSNRSKREKISFGKLIRRAVEKEYLEVEDEALKKRRGAIDKIFKIRKVSKTPIDYKALINYGRKY